MGQIPIIDHPGDVQGKHLDALTGDLLNASLEIRWDRIIYSPSPVHGQHFHTNIKGFKAIDGQVSFDLIAPSRITVLSTVAATLTLVREGEWDEDAGCFTGLEPGGRRAIVANALAEIGVSGKGLLMQAAALGATDSIKIFIEGYAR